MNLFMGSYKQPFSPPDRESVTAEVRFYQLLMPRKLKSLLRLLTGQG